MQQNDNEIMNNILNNDNNNPNVQNNNNNQFQQLQQQIQQRLHQNNQDPALVAVPVAVAVAGPALVAVQAAIPVPEDNNNNNNNNNRYNNSITSSDLHEAILANSQSVVELLLAQGVNPNRSPQLAPVGVIAASSSERARDLHRSLGRVFRSRQGGTIHPLHVAVCNAYHHCVFGRESAIGIVNALLKASADRRSTCSGIAFCKVGTHPTVTIASSKTCDKVALFLKRFPLVTHPTECCSMMDTVATLILQQVDDDDNDHNGNDPITGMRLNHHHAGASNSSEYNSNNNVPGSASSYGNHYRNDSFSQFPTTTSTTTTTTTTPVICTHTLRTWNKLLEDSSFTDLIFQCPDGQVGAHKSILIAAVPYFATALQGPWKEGNRHSTLKEDDGNDDDDDATGDDDATSDDHTQQRNKSNNNKISRSSNSNCDSKQIWTTSNSVATMKVVLQFVYTGQVEVMDRDGKSIAGNNDNDNDDAVDIPTLLSVATEYQLQVLQDHYEQELIKGLSVETVASTLQLAHLHHLVTLQNKCHDFSHLHATTVLVHPAIMALATQPNDVWNDLVEGLATRNTEQAASNKKRKLTANLNSNH
eukprot:CAMPEP_0119006382 /NCGR_PEP_ID=MMETSP1176-20130426/2265_1 /TAXON_ID=265551 /ORGANISM="Synedropsis recta cf, Strain CCMP1620" /LENGTH=588 /DNA_ID=CAMNT_0006958291 /DNA_START=127 /DNA_END=1893 /DNA_ORIENTATION=+